MNRLRELRLKSGLTLAELSKKVGINQNYISQIERGDRPLNPKTLKKFCDFYKVKPNELLGYDKMTEVKENDNEFKEEDIRILRTIKALSDEDYNMLIEYVGFLIYRHKQKLEAYNDKERHSN